MYVSPGVTLPGFDAGLPRLLAVSMASYSISLSIPSDEKTKTSKQQQQQMGIITVPVS